jgi:putative transposase
LSSYSFKHPFGRIPVTTDVYFIHLVAYIHHNPQTHGLVDDFRAWFYSSYHALKSQAPTRLWRDDVLAWFGGQKQFETYHEREPNTHLFAYLVADDQDPKGFKNL